MRPIEIIFLSTILLDYKNGLRFYKNFFIANKKLISKKYPGIKCKKKYDNAKTPY
jgi:hypothetical protein